MTNVIVPNVLDVTEKENEQQQGSLADVIDPVASGLDLAGLGVRSVVGSSAPAPNAVPAALPADAAPAADAAAAAADGATSGLSDVLSGIGDVVSGIFDGI